MPMSPEAILACLTSRLKTDKKHLVKVLDKNPELRHAVIKLLGA